MLNHKQKPKFLLSIIALCLFQQASYASEDNKDSNDTDIIVITNDQFIDNLIKNTFKSYVKSDRLKLKDPFEDLNCSCQQTIDFIPIGCDIIVLSHLGGYASFNSKKDQKVILYGDYQLHPHDYSNPELYDHITSSIVSYAQEHRNPVVYNSLLEDYKVHLELLEEYKILKNELMQNTDGFMFGTNCLPVYFLLSDDTILWNKDHIKALLYLHQFGVDTIMDFPVKTLRDIANGSGGDKNIPQILIKDTDAENLVSDAILSANNYDEIIVLHSKDLQSDLGSLINTIRYINSFLAAYKTKDI